MCRIVYRSQISESFCAGAGLRPERREVLHSGHAPYHITEVRSCCGMVPERSICSCAPASSDGPLASHNITEVRSCCGDVPHRFIHTQTSLDELREGEFLTAPAFPCREVAQVVWIADTRSANHFCSYDTLPGDVFDGMRPCPDMRLATANGIIEPEGRLEVYLTDLGVDARFLVLKDCPPVLSIGRLVEQHGFQFLM